MSGPNSRGRGWNGGGFNRGKEGLGRREDMAVSMLAGYFGAEEEIDTDTLRQIRTTDVISSSFISSGRSVGLPRGVNGRAPLRFLFPSMSSVHTIFFLPFSPGYSSPSDPTTADFRESANHFSFDTVLAFPTVCRLNISPRYLRALLFISIVYTPVREGKEETIGE